MMLMIVVILAVLGAAMGSFVGALVWRLHEHKDFVRDRSECEHCHHKLDALDLIPVLSWLVLRGRCRYCRAWIGWTPLALELLTAGLFVGSYIMWPWALDSWLAWTFFGLWLVQLVGLVALFVYDLKWMLLPNVIVFPLIGLSIVEVAVGYGMQSDASLGAYIQSAFLGVAVLAGLYWALYTFSRGRLIGYGDVKLGLFMGLVLGWQRALLALFLANIIGFFVVLPGLLTGRLKRTSRVPFGPFLIIAFIISFLLGDRLIDWYLGFILVK
jgi:leader peptidase (prepilin peptidase) / N-methyltransferase